MQLAQTILFELPRVRTLFGLQPSRFGSHPIRLRWTIWKDQWSFFFRTLKWYSKLWARLGLLNRVIVRDQWLVDLFLSFSHFLFFFPKEQKNTLYRTRHSRKNKRYANVHVQAVRFASLVRLFNVNVQHEVKKKRKKRNHRWNNDTYCTE